MAGAKSGTGVAPFRHPIGAEKDESGSKNAGCGTEREESGTGVFASCQLRVASCQWDRRRAEGARVDSGGGKKRRSPHGRAP